MRLIPREPAAPDAVACVEAAPVAAANKDCAPLAGIISCAASLCCPPVAEASEQHTATHCNTLQHITTHCNTLQHTTIHCTEILKGEGYGHYIHVYSHV